MIRRYIVVEEHLDKIILENLLPNNIVSQSRFIISNGYTSAISKARTLLVIKELPVFLIVDADTIDQSSVEERKDFLEQFIGHLSTPDFFQLFVAVPEIAILFFYEKETLEKITHKKISETQWELAKYQPKMVLNDIIQGGSLQKLLMNSSTPDLIQKLRDTEPIKRIIKSINSLQNVSE